MFINMFFEKFRDRGKNRDWSIIGRIRFWTTLDYVSGICLLSLIETGNKMSQCFY